ncbi:MAG: DUF1722 domain-containing protein [Desulfuromusa sp.]|nr:DUF1722 domain-containing protein [Desulfuromusa sp.]
MRIWDINPGYLNRQSLLGEHRELHGIASIIENNKKGYSSHPETVRWVGYQWALKQRHLLLSSEMTLRGYKDKTPVIIDGNTGQWPTTFIDEPFMQFRLLETKYLTKEQGRIPLPKSAQQLWSQHKYSILARNVNLYKKIGREVSDMKPNQDFSELAMILTAQLRIQPLLGGLINALQHMWGHVSDLSSVSNIEFESWSPCMLLTEIQKLTLTFEDKYLGQSTALSELEVWSKNIVI